MVCGRYARILIAWTVLSLVSDARAAEGGPPVLVELYTSQGCSSCPPADELMSSWGMDAFKRGEIVPLAYHVDYWDRLGWKDPFSSPVFTRRQRATAVAFGLRYAYTPQMVVNGRVEFNGSNRHRAETEVARLESSPPAADIEVRRRWKGPLLGLTVKVSPDTSLPDDLRVMLAVFENGHVTRVERGENAGRVLKGDFVVRQLADLGPLRTGKGKVSERMAEVTWPKEWRKENAGAAVFLQDAKNFSVYGVRSVFPLE